MTYVQQYAMCRRHMEEHILVSHCITYHLHFHRAILFYKVGMNRKDLGGESDNMPCMWVWTVGVLENTFHLVAHSSGRTGKRKMEKEPEKSRMQNHHHPDVSDGYRASENI